MKAFTVKNTWSNHHQHGWGNGYVAIPPTSSWHGVDYHQIPVSVHGGLTWSSKASEVRERGVEVPPCIDGNDWVVGFDTVRLWDAELTEQDVERETYKLLGALEQLISTPYVNDTTTYVRCPHCQSLNNISDSVDYDKCRAETHAQGCTDCHKSFYFSI